MFAIGIKPLSLILLILVLTLVLSLIYVNYPALKKKLDIKQQERKDNLRKKIDIAVRESVLDGYSVVSEHQVNQACFDKQTVYKLDHPPVIVQLWLGSKQIEVNDVEVSWGLLMPALTDVTDVRFNFSPAGECYGYKIHILYGVTLGEELNKKIDDLESALLREFEFTKNRMYEMDVRFSTR